MMTLIDESHVLIILCDVTVKNIIDKFDRNRKYDALTIAEIAQLLLFCRGGQQKGIHYTILILSWNQQSEEDQETE